MKMKRNGLLGMVFSLLIGSSLSYSASQQQSEIYQFPGIKIELRFGNIDEQNDLAAVVSVNEVSLPDTIIKNVEGGLGYSESASLLDDEVGASQTHLSATSINNPFPADYKYKIYVKSSCVEGPLFGQLVANAYKKSLDMYSDLARNRFILGTVKRGLAIPVITDYQEPIKMIVNYAAKNQTLFGPGTVRFVFSDDQVGRERFAIYKEYLDKAYRSRPNRC